MPVLQAALWAYQQAMKEANLGERDGTALPAYWSARKKPEH
jgi:hypothetical protein